jgi:hypothetical protein
MGKKKINAKNSSAVEELVCKISTPMRLCAQCSSNRIDPGAEPAISKEINQIIKNIDPVSPAA